MLPRPGRGQVQELVDSEERFRAVRKALEP